MTKLVGLGDLKYHALYRFHLDEPIGESRERIYLGRETLGREDFIKVSKPNGQFSPSIAIASITDIEPLDGINDRKRKLSKAKRKK